MYGFFISQRNVRSLTLWVGYAINCLNRRPALEKWATWNTFLAEKWHVVNETNSCTQHFQKRDITINGFRFQGMIRVLNRGTLNSTSKTKVGLFCNMTVQKPSWPLRPSVSNFIIQLIIKGNGRFSTRWWSFAPHNIRQPVIMHRYSRYEETWCLVTSCNWSQKIVITISSEYVLKLRATKPIIWLSLHCPGKNCSVWWFAW